MSFIVGDVIPSFDFDLLVAGVLVLFDFKLKEFGESGALLDSRDREDLGDGLFSVAARTSGGNCGPNE